MTRDQIASNIANNLEDSNLKFFTAANINAAIQDGYDEISSYAMQIEKTIEITLDANLVYYDMPTLAADYLCVSRIFNTRNNRWLQPVNSQYLDSIRFDWETWIGEPTYFFPHSWQHLAIAPHKIGSLLVYYRSTADVLQAATAPSIYRDSDILLEYYATADLFMQAKEWDKASIWYQQYATGLEQYRNMTKEMAFSDYNVCLR